VADTKGMPKKLSSATRHLSKLMLVGALALTGGCTYFWVPDVNNPPKSAPWTPLPTTTSVTDGAKFKDGAVYCDKPTPPKDMGSYTRSVVNCWQDWAHNRVTATTSGRHYYWFVYRHFNDFGRAGISQCDKSYWSDTLGDDLERPAPTAENLGKWVTTFTWTDNEMPNMHGCGGHGPGWRRHMEQRVVFDIKDVTTTSKTVKVDDGRTLVDTRNIDQVKVVPT
jgi:hypothetical protein